MLPRGGFLCTASGALLCLPEGRRPRSQEMEDPQLVLEQLKTIFKQADLDSSGGTPSPCQSLA